MRKDDYFSTSRPARFVTCLVNFCKGLTIILNLQNLMFVGVTERYTSTLFLNGDNMFSKKEIIVWIFAAIVGISLAYACRLEAMI